MRRVVVAALLCFGLAACNQDMSSQPKYDEYKPAPLFRNDQTMQTPVAGTVARDDRARAQAMTTRPPLTQQLLERGQQRFDIFCAPCHGRLGDASGMIVARGMPQPPSFHIDRLRKAPDQHFFDVITHGYGVMYSYGDRVPPRDRWAIVAYIRALQLSQHAALDDLPPAVRARLTGTQP